MDAKLVKIVSFGAKEHEKTEDMIADFLSPVHLVVDEVLQSSTQFRDREGKMMPWTTISIWYHFAIKD